MHQLGVQCTRAVHAEVRWARACIRIFAVVVTASDLPAVLSGDELAPLIAASTNFKLQTALSLAEASGMQASEVVSLNMGRPLHSSPANGYTHVTNHMKVWMDRASITPQSHLSRL